MNKRGQSEILSKELGFILLAGLILLFLSFGIAKLWSAVYSVFTPSEDLNEGDFSRFEQVVNKVIETKESRYFNLKLNYNDVIFETGDNPFELQNELTYKNPVTFKEIKFKKIEKPKECSEDSNCICKCNLSYSLNQKNEAYCLSSVSCINLGEHTKIDGNMIVNYPSHLLDSLKVEDQDTFLILASLDQFSLVRKKALSSEKTYSVPLFIKKDGLKLKITYNS